ncbi:MAG: hypothetical protein ACQESR_10470, partial [Planctomycetota bacterium]
CLWIVRHTGSARDPCFLERECVLPLAQPVPPAVPLDCPAHWLRSRSLFSGEGMRLAARSASATRRNSPCLWIVRHTGSARDPCFLERECVLPLAQPPAEACVP